MRCEECALWLWVQKKREQWEYEEHVAEDTNSPDMWKRYGAWMAGRRAQELREMTVEEYKEKLKREQGK